MKQINQTAKYLVLISTAFVLMGSAMIAAPARAHAFDAGRLIDPLCLFACDDRPRTVTNTYTNSNNVNSNINSPGATVNTAQGQLAYGYNYDYNYHPTPQPTYPSLQVSCYPSASSIRTGDNVTWQANITGGNGSYYSTWTGTDNLFGYGSSVYKVYYSTGYKSASITVSSAGQTITRDCSSAVNVTDTTYYYPPTTYYPPTYYPPTTYYSPLTVSCSPNTTSVTTNSTVYWNAYVSGGNGSYSYSWSGTDGIYGSSQSIAYVYNNAGQKYASVTVYSNGQSVSQSCNYSVNVGGYNYNPGYVNNVYYNSNNYNSNNNGLDVACYSDPTTARVNQPITWRAEVTGGIAPYTYSWTGSNDLAGSESTVIKYYSSVGDKNAIVTIKSADGKTATRACSTSLTIRSASTAAPAAPTQPAVQATPNQNNQNNGLSAAALFSLKNVPWGWVAILVILVLFATVAYLLFNRPKI